MSYYGNLLGFVQGQQGLGEQQRQFNLGFNEDSRRFNNQFGEGQRQFDNSFLEGRRQFNENLGLNYEQLGQGLLGLISNIDAQQFGQDLQTFAANENADQQQFQNLFNTLAAFMPQEQDGRVNAGAAFNTVQNQDAMRMQAQQNANNNFWGGAGALAQIGMAANPSGWLASGVGSFFSSHAFKDKTGDVDPREALDIVRNLPVDRWKYHGDDEEHIGTYAEEFNEAIGKDGQTINAIDYLGVLTAAVQELARRVG